MFLLTGAVRAEFPNTTFAYSTNVSVGDLQIKLFNLLNIEVILQSFILVESSVDLL